MPKPHVQKTAIYRLENGANAVRKKLRLNGTEEAEYPCPVEQCIHRPFKSKRGCRKHVDTRHGWYYYFSTAPVLTPCERNAATDADKRRPSTSAQPAFSVDEGFGNQLLLWLCTTCGGSKNVKDARRECYTCMKFLMFSSGNNLDEMLIGNRLSTVASVLRL